jgi:hypothetical protein
MFHFFGSIDSVCPTTAELDSKVLVDALRPQDVARMRLVNAVAGESTAVYDFLLARIVTAGLLAQVEPQKPRRMVWVNETQTELTNP